MMKVALLLFVVFALTGCAAPEPIEESPAHTLLPIKHEAQKTQMSTPETNEPPATPKKEFIHNYTTARADCRECHPDYPWPRILDIPFYEQETNDSCGQAVLQMTLAYYGINKTQKQISKEMKAGETYPSDLSLYLQKQGLNAYVIELGDDMWEFDPYAGKYPVIVLEHGELVDIPLHWVLLKGRGVSGYIMIDPRGGGRTGWIPGENYTSIVVEGPVLPI